MPRRDGPWLMLVLMVAALGISLAKGWQAPHREVTAPQEVGATRLNGVTRGMTRAQVKASGSRPTDPMFEIYDREGRLWSFSGTILEARGATLRAPVPMDDVIRALGPYQSAVGVPCSGAVGHAEWRVGADRVVGFFVADRVTSFVLSGLPDDLRNLPPTPPGD